MNITYREACPEDAAQLLEFLRAVGGESDYLTFGPRGIPLTVEQEEKFLANLQESPINTIILAFDGNKIVGNGCIDGNKNPRFAHRCSLALAVRKDYWGRGIGSGLMERLIAFAKSIGAETIGLEVISENERAKALYQKFGFSCFGTFQKHTKIGDRYFDLDYMNLYLK